MSLVENFLVAIIPIKLLFIYSDNCFLRTLVRGRIQDFLKLAYDHKRECMPQSGASLETILDDCMPNVIFFSDQKGRITFTSLILTKSTDCNSFLTYD